jgi:hypothetical protein
MSPSHVRRNQRAKVIEELSEDEAPEPGLPRPVFGSEEFVKVRKWQTNRTFVFLGATATACLAAVAASPNAMVLAAIGLIWAGALLLAWFLITSTYHGRR